MDKIFTVEIYDNYLYIAEEGNSVYKKEITDPSKIGELIQEYLSK